MKSSLFVAQMLPLILAVAIFAVLAESTYLIIAALNLFPLSAKIILQLRITDILVGITIYLKTAVDFAIFMGRLMGSNPGWKNRVAIETGTAVGNWLGTVAVMIIWTFFKEIKILLAAMVLLASLVLLELAEGGLHHFDVWKNEKGVRKLLYRVMKNFLTPILRFISPVLSLIMPDISTSMKGKKNFPWGKLLIFSFSIPFILGLDDFAGYVPLFNVVNIFGFSIGVLLAHMILNLALFVSPKRTVRLVKNAWVSFFGSLIFILLAFWGFYEVGRILLLHS